MNKIKNYYNLINSIEIENADYREIFDNAVKYVYHDPLNEYTENGINAIMVNNIRHNYSNYDQITRLIHRIHRCDYDYEQYKNCVLEKISNAYPLLEHECKRQKYQINMVKVL